MAERRHNMHDARVQEPNSGARRLASHPLLGTSPRATARVSVDGRELLGVTGEPLAALLLAHDLITLRRTPQSGAARGLFCGVGRCSDCLITVDGELNVRACVTPVRDGMLVETHARPAGQPGTR